MIVDYRGFGQAQEPIFQIVWVYLLRMVFFSSYCYVEIMRRLGFDLILLFLIVLMIVGFSSYLDHFFGAYHENVEIDLSFWHLPQYAFFSLARGFFAFCLSLVFSLAFGFWAAKDRIAEKFLIPLLDILQSIPILGFLPGVVLLLIGLFKQSNVGLEIAAILLMFTGQVWNMVFCVYHSVRTIPIEKNQCATAYGFNSFQRFRWVEIPFSSPSLIWNSIMSVAGGWFFLMINEAFKLGNRDFRLPGLGAYMSVAADHGDIFAMLLAILAMIGLILFLNQFIWRPLIVWSQKFRIEETGAVHFEESWFLNILKHSLLISALRRVFRELAHIIQNQKSKTTPIQANFHWLCLIMSWTILFILALLIAIAVFSSFNLLKVIDFKQWMHLGKLLLLTFIRVYTCVIISVLVMLPFGLLIGLSEKLNQKLQPLIQTAASFPASLLFPIVIVIFQWLKIPLGIGSIVLMLMGTQWYVLFNVIAGARAIPSDMKEVADSFHYSRLQRFFWLYLPAVFPYLITGILSAAGGAWNASVVAEYVNTQQNVLTTPGIGSMISIAAQNNDYSLLAGSIFIMIITVAFLNYQVWLRLYHYSEKRFALNV